ncbi:hypothetical protein E2562_002021 [Oryza meyeriana var. granulata]|uniref:Uncharacterized protein n=1 Tax=Oryza meyeriana var. granulata TaxID=110450 RepID=A0A6G1C5A5_9ORYZ|nr:hypothetical protein E2562_002021 [Oryza meyeriana var. granulata]
MAAAMQTKEDWKDKCHEKHVAVLACMDATVMASTIGEPSVGLSLPGFVRSDETAPISRHLATQLGPCPRYPAPHGWKEPPVQRFQEGHHIKDAVVVVLDIRNRFSPREFHPNARRWGRPL